MYKQLLKKIIFSLKWKDWLCIVFSLVSLYAFNYLIIKWLQNESKQIVKNAGSNAEGIVISKENFLNQKLNKSVKKIIRNEQLTQRQKINAKQARQQRREAFEARQRLKEVKQNLYEKRINKKIIEILLEKKKALERDQKEYENWKQKIEIHEAGSEFKFEDLDDEYISLTKFINTIISKKIVDINDLSAEFQLKVEDIVSRIQELEEQEIIDGVLTDKGQYIYISESEWEYISSQICVKGKISKARDLAEICNKVIQD